MSSQLPPSQEGDQSQTHTLLTMTIIMLVLSATMVILRFVVRVFVVKGLWWDDWTILGALLGVAIGDGLMFVAFNFGLGRHHYYINGPYYNRILYLLFGDWIQIFATLMWTKISICLFLSRIPATNALRRPLYAAVAVLVVSNIILTLLWILQCSPINAAWDYSVSGTCFTKDQLLQIILAQGLISIVSDFALAAYPILILMRVQISLRKKIGLYILMSFGAITGACSIVRNALNWSNESPDTSWDSVPNYMWRCLEINFGIAAACIPAVYPGYRAIQKRYTNYRSRQSKATALDSDKEPVWPNPNLSTTAPSNTTTTIEAGIYNRPDVPISNADILKMTEFSVNPETNSTWLPSPPLDQMVMREVQAHLAAVEAEKEMEMAKAEEGKVGKEKKKNEKKLESPRRAAQKADLANLERERREELERPPSSSAIELTGI